MERRLAIKGHATRGKEVIEILEMLGGISRASFEGNLTDSAYIMMPNMLIRVFPLYLVRYDSVPTFTLEEFEKLYPYKVGDKVKCHDIWKGIIESMEWHEGEVLYHVRDSANGFIAHETKEYLYPYKEETMEETRDKPKIQKTRIMIDYIKVSYLINGVQVTLSIEDSDNLPYDLAEMFRRVINDTNANPNIVINELKDNYDTTE